MSTEPKEPRIKWVLETLSFFVWQGARAFFKRGHGSSALPVFKKNKQGSSTNQCDPNQAWLERAVTALSQAAHKHALITAVLAVAILGAAALGFYNLRFDNSIAALLPDGAERESGAAGLLDITPAARLLVVELKAANGQDMPALTAAAKAVKASLQNYLLPDPAPFVASPLPWLRLLPALADAELLAAIEQKSLGAHEAPAGLRLRLAGNEGMIPKSFIRADPLGFLGLLAERFKWNTGGISIGGFGDDFSVLPNQGRLLMLLRPTTSMHDAAAARDLLRAVKASLAAHLPEGATFELAGSFCHTAANTEAIERDLKLTSVLALILIAIIYFCFVRARAIPWLMLLPGASVLAGGAFLGIVFNGASGLALGFGSGVMGLTADYGVLIHFALRCAGGNGPGAAALLARPMLCSAALCMASFMVLTLSSIPAMRQMGLFSAFAVFFAVTMAIFILPRCPGMGGTQTGADPTISNKTNPSDACKIVSAYETIGNAAQDDSWKCALERMAPATKVIAACWAVLLLFCLAAGLNLPFNHSVRDMGMDTASLQATWKEIATRWGMEAEPLTIACSGASYDDALQNSANVVAGLRKAHPEAEIVALSSFMPPQDQQRANIARWKKFQSEKSGVIVNNLNAGAAGIFSPQAFTSFESWLMEQPMPIERADLEKAGLTLLLWSLEAQKNSRHYALIMARGIAPEATAKVQSALPAEASLLNSANITRQIEQGFSQERGLFLWACLACSILPLFYFRRLALAALACLPALLGLGAVLAWLLISGQSLTLAGMSALILLVGLGTDYGIIMLHELARADGFGASRAILVSSLTTLAGIGVLILARHPVLHDMGLVIFLGMLAEMLAVFLLVPRLARCGDKKPVFSFS